MEIHISITAFYWRNDTHNLCYLTVFIHLGRPLACSSYTFYHHLKIFNSLYWLPWKMPHQRFQRFDFKTEDWITHDSIFKHVSPFSTTTISQFPVFAFVLSPLQNKSRRQHTRLHQNFILLIKKKQLWKSLYCHIVSRHPLNSLPNKPWFLLVCSTSRLETLWEKEKLLVTSNFSLFHSVFNPFGELSAIFIKFEIIVCKLFQFGRV